MQREILFRGKLKKSNKFIYGLPTCDFSYIFNSSQVDSCDNYEVIPETIGQFTGMIDKNGTKIFEGDIIDLSNKYSKIEIRNAKVYYEEASFKINKSIGCYSNFLYGWNLDYEVIGNVYDNPELIYG